MKIVIQFLAINLDNFKLSLDNSGYIYYSPHTQNANLKPFPNKLTNEQVINATEVQMCQILNYDDNVINAGDVKCGKN